MTDIFEIEVALFDGCILKYEDFETESEFYISYIGGYMVEVIEETKYFEDIKRLIGISTFLEDLNGREVSIYQI